MTDKQAKRAKALLEQLYFYAPDYWTGADDAAGRAERDGFRQGDIDIIASALASPVPVWTKERPTVPGWYWWKRKFHELSIHQVSKGDYFIWVPKNDPGEWAGPIQPPQEGGA